MEPFPNGQIPAMARNKVDLPAPDGPVTRVRSLPLMLKLSAQTNGVPLGNRTRSRSRAILSLPGDDTTSIEEARAPSVGGRASPPETPGGPRPTARHSASVR